MRRTGAAFQRHLAGLPGTTLPPEQLRPGLLQSDHRAAARVREQEPLHLKQRPPAAAAELHCPGVQWQWLGLRVSQPTGRDPVHLRTPKKPTPKPENSERHLVARVNGTDACSEGARAHRAIVAILGFRVLGR